MNPRILKLPPNKQGLVIDGLIILLNIFLFPFLTRHIQNLFSEAFRDNQPAFQALGLIMLIVLAGRLAGLYLKRFPLQSRMRSSDASFSIYFLVFNAPIMILTAVFGAVVLLDLAAAAGLVPRGANGLPKESQAVSMTVVLSIIFLTCVEIYLMYRLGKPLTDSEAKKAREGNWLYGFPGEFLADFGLFAYMMIWQVFYYFTAGILLEPANPAAWTWDTQLFSVGFMLICFVLFYVSPRAVFLTEDRKYLSTWALILLVFLTSLIPQVIN